LKQAEIEISLLKVSKQNCKKNLPPKKNLKSSNPKGSLPQAGGRGVWGEFRPPYKFWAKSVRIFSNAHRQLENEVIGSPATRARQPILASNRNCLPLFREAERQKRDFSHF